MDNVPEVQRINSMTCYEILMISYPNPVEA